MILGNGGAAAAAYVFVLESLGIEVVHVTRNHDDSVRTIRFDELTPEAVRFFGLIVQATPVGTVPNVSDVLPFPWSGLNDEHLVIDLIYNPTETLLSAPCEVPRSDGAQWKRHAIQSGPSCMGMVEPIKMIDVVFLT